jgi:hypothetical protein
MYIYKLLLKLWVLHSPNGKFIFYELKGIFEEGMGNISYTYVCACVEVMMAHMHVYLNAYAFVCW